MDNSMRKNDSDQPNDDDRFKPAHFLVYYLQRLFIWGEWSIGNAKKKTRNQPGLPHASGAIRRRCGARGWVGSLH
jgi:hypothetical protein